MIRILGVLLICFILVSLLIGMVNIVRDRSRSTRVARALTWRVVLSITLFVVVMLAIFHEQGPG